MIRRPLWLGAGMAIGVGGTLWAEQRVKRRVRQLSAALTPAGATDELRRSVRVAGERVRAAVDDARLERRRREAELWAAVERPLTAARSDGRPKGVLQQHR